jgi:NAD+ kinase
LKNRAEQIRRIGIVGNPDKSPGREAIRLAVRLIRASGREVVTEPATAALASLRAEQHPTPRDLARNVDLLLVFGGDGTMLHVARATAGVATPLLGINVGGLGFLTAVSSNDLPQALKTVWRDGFKFERRALIEAAVRVRGRQIRKLALNDVVVGRGEVPRLIDLEVAVNRDPLTRYRCDGLIVSSPTGSTAYSLAAGGAVVLPTAEVFALTPICPHTLSNRSLIVPLAATIRICPVNQRAPTVLSADGEVISELAPGAIVTVRRSRYSVRLMHLADSSFFEALRRKLHWRGAYL